MAAAVHASMIPLSMQRWVVMPLREAVRGMPKRQLDD